jgi:hypothetical protein
MFPAINKKRAFIIETDKIGLGSPSQSVSDMYGRSAATVKFFIAVRAMMYFIKIFFTGIQHFFLQRKYVSEVYKKTTLA